MLNPSCETLTSSALNWAHILRLLQPLEGPDRDEAGRCIMYQLYRARQRGSGRQLADEQLEIAMTKPAIALIERIA